MNQPEPPTTSQPGPHTDAVRPEERAFYVAEFAAATVVVALSRPDADTVAAIGRAAEALASGGSRLVLVVGADHRGAAEVAADLPAVSTVLDGSSGAPDARWLAELWLAVTDQLAVLVSAPAGTESSVAARLATSLRALKLVITDPGGGWGRPARSFADVATHQEAFERQLADRQGGRVSAAISTALGGGVTSVNLCRPADLDRELFTFDGAGTLFTSGGYLRLASLRVDDLPAIERLVGQGVADGLVRPRPRLEVARLAIGGLGAKVVRSGHLAGVVGLETEPYRQDGIGEVASLYTVSRFSGAGAGGLLIDGLVEQAVTLGLEALFAVTVSDAAAQFFTRKGFIEVGSEQVPEVKWKGYDPARKGVARVLWYSIDLTG